MQWQPRKLISSLSVIIFSVQILFQRFNSTFLVNLLRTIFCASECKPWLNCQWNANKFRSEAKKLFLWQITCDLSSSLSWGEKENFHFTITTKELVIIFSLISSICMHQFFCCWCWFKGCHDSCLSFILI